jgi:MOSC domain-containing protein YiiM/GNAT superfamily N-acetyltransferase
MLAEGRVLHVNVSRGGVPKRPVDAARVTVLGLDGDRQNDVTVHGGPHRAVCLLGIEAIRRVAAEGHPIAPGTTGENLTVEGFDVSALAPGTRLAVGADVVLEIAAPAAPCETIRESFRDGRFSRLGANRHPDDSRMYARVLVEGEVRPGDPVRVEPPTSDAAELHIRAVELDGAEAAWSRSLWRAAKDGGETVHVVADGDLSFAAAPGIPHPSFNAALGLVMLPHLAGLATQHFDRHRTIGWLLADAPPVPGLRPEFELGRHTVDPSETRRPDPDPEVDVRECAPGEIGPWADAVAAAGDLPLDVARAWRAAEPGLARSGHHHRFVAWHAGRPVGAASLHTHHGVGWLCAASVVPDARGRGIQRQLVAARVERAAALGCHLVGASVVVGGASERNVGELGFRRIATRHAYRYEPRPA